jgi:uncharacterized protein
MRILVDIGHPAHVHFYKNAIWQLESRGHKVQITTRDKEVTLDLLNAYKLNYYNVGKNKKGLSNKAINMMKIDSKIYKIAKKFDPDLLTGIHSPYIAQIGKILNKPSLIFTDTEHAKLANLLTFPFASAIITPSCFKGDLGKKHIRYNGYHELAYLNPKYFTPDPSVLNDLGLNENDRFIILRFVAWNATHDLSSQGVPIESIKRTIHQLESYGKIYITSELPLGNDFNKYILKTSPEKLHSLLYYAALYFGDGGTTAVEAALLGTPAVHYEAYSTKSGEVVDVTNLHGNFEELVNKYQLLYTFANFDDTLNKATFIMENHELKREMREKTKCLMKEKTDVTKYMVDLIEQKQYT